MLICSSGCMTGQRPQCSVTLHASTACSLLNSTELFKTNIIVIQENCDLFHCHNVIDIISLITFVFLSCMWKQVSCVVCCCCYCFVLLCCCGFWETFKKEKEIFLDTSQY